MKKLHSILLVDDYDADNYLHRMVLDEMDCAEHIEVAVSGPAALRYLEQADAPPDLLFLDINMPGMNGWEFLDEFETLPPEKQAKVVVVMLTTSLNPADRAAAEARGLVSSFFSKPLTGPSVARIIGEHFSDGAA